MTQLSYKSANELAQMILNKEISSSELLEYYIWFDFLNSIVLLFLADANPDFSDDEIEQGTVERLLRRKFFRNEIGVYILLLIVDWDNYPLSR